MKRLRFLFIAVALILGGALGYRFLAGWLISGAFQEASRSGDLNRLADVLEASAGATLARGETYLQPQGGGSNQVGAIRHYEQHPEQLRRDKAYFGTWRSALTIAKLGFESGHDLEKWTRSTDIAWIPEPNREDSWGHPFCVRINELQAFVVSPGSGAVSSFDCTTLRLSQDELVEIPPARLYKHPSGAIVLSLQRSQVGPTAVRH